MVASEACEMMSYPPLGCMRIGPSSQAKQRAANRSHSIVIRHWSLTPPRRGMWPLPRIIREGVRE
jgi:hypothetical protein